MGSFNGSFYYYSQTINLWSQADSICNSLGGHLVTISDVAENNFINNFSNGMGIWLGLTDENNEGIFQWSNGDSLTFTNWLPNQPDNFTNSGNPNGQDYVLMEPSWKMG